MRLRSPVRAGNGAGAFAHLFGRGTPRAEEEAPSDEKKPDGEGAEDEDGEEDDETKPKPGEAEPEAEGAAAAARAEERARCRAIFAAPEAANNVAMAAHLAFDTNQTAAEAVATLKLSGKASSLGARMAGVKDIALGAGDVKGGDSKAQAAASWDAAFKRAGIATTPKA